MWNGRLRGYILLYRRVEDPNYQEINIQDPETTQTTLTSLEKFVNFEFLVKAYNSIGRGPPSTPVVVFVGEAGT